MTFSEYMILASSFALGAGGGWVISRWGDRWGLTDIPNERSSHSRPTPKGGGIGILAAVLICSISFSIPKSFWIPAVLLSFFSLFGDHSEIRPQIRLLFQFTAGTILLIGILIGNGSGIASYTLIPLLATFVVGTANYYNFMDGINGIAAITGLFGFGLLGWFAAAGAADPKIIALCVCMSLSCLGFLPFNIYKARAFMGDVGSVLLGFVFAGLVVWVSRSYLDFVCATSFLFPFYADELTTLFVRIKDGDRLLRPHRKHLYQLLTNEYRILHWKVSLGYGAFQLIVGVSILLLKGAGSMAVLSMLVFYFCAFSILSYFLRRKMKFRI
jgi:UDP-N-acetylmuramyl pentapeptide phosphotransferase/UDP-N-acetylglucosamine-1-phosphate transferase